MVVLACGNNSRSKLPASGNYGTKVKTDSVITVNDAINLMQSNTKANVKSSISNTLVRAANLFDELT